MFSCIVWQRTLVWSRDFDCYSKNVSNTTNVSEFMIVWAYSIVTYKTFYDKMHVYKKLSSQVFVKKILRIDLMKYFDKGKDKIENKIN